MKGFSRIISLNLSTALWGGIMTLILQLRKLRLRLIAWLAQSPQVHNRPTGTDSGSILFPCPGQHRANTRLANPLTTS